MGTYKINVIQADVGIFMFISEYLEIIQAVSVIVRTLSKGNIDNQVYIQNPGMFRILLYSEPWHLENQGHIQDPDIFRNLVYLEP